MPDYGGIELADTATHELSVPPWAGPARVRTGVHADVGQLSVVEAPGLARAHPYLQPDGHGWPDNDRRFLTFCQAVAAIVRSSDPDVVHLNDWHTGATLAAVDGSIPSVLSLHNLAYQGFTDGAWLRHLGPRGGHYEWFGGTNPLSGAIALADAIVAVSPTHAREILTPDGGFGLDGRCGTAGPQSAGSSTASTRRSGIRETDPALVRNYSAHTKSGGAHDRPSGEPRRRSRPGRVPERRRPAGRDGLPADRSEGRRPARADRADPALDPAASRRPRLRRGGHRRAAVCRRRRRPGVVLVRQRLRRAVRPSAPRRWRPAARARAGSSRAGSRRCRRCATGPFPWSPTSGGLHDTVADADFESDGTGFRAPEATSVAFTSALFRASRHLATARRRNALSGRGMKLDWSWSSPAAEYVELYERLAGASG